MRVSSARLGRRRPELMGYGRFVSQTVVEDSGWEPNGVTHPVRFCEGGGTYPLRGCPPLLSKSACCVRCGGSWKRSYGTTYTGTKGETPDTDKVAPSEPPRQLSTPTKLESKDSISAPYGVCHNLKVSRYRVLVHLAGYRASPRPCWWNAIIVSLGSCMSILTGRNTWPRIRMSYVLVPTDKNSAAVSTLSGKIAFSFLSKLTTWVFSISAAAIKYVS